MVHEIPIIGKLIFENTGNKFTKEASPELTEGSYNGSAVRLEDVVYDNKDTIIKLGETDFFSFLATNMYEPYESDTAVGLDSKFANILAVSVLLLDDEDNFIMVKRTGNVKIGTGLYSVSATGSVDVCDLKAKNPIIAAAIREVKEELGYKLKPADLEFDGLVMGTDKHQPVALVTGRVKRKRTKTGSDPDKEIRSMKILTKSALVQCQSRFPMTEVARHHIELQLNEW